MPFLASLPLSAFWLLSQYVGSKNTKIYHAYMPAPTHSSMMTMNFTKFQICEPQIKCFLLEVALITMFCHANIKVTKTHVHIIENKSLKR